MRSTTVVTAAALALLAGSASAQSIVAQGDVVIGWSQGSTPTPTQQQLDRTVELFAPTNPLTIKTDPWNQFPFIQGVAFDNTGGIRRNPSGKLIGIDFGPAPAAGFRLYQFNTQQPGSTIVMLNGFGGVGPQWSTFPTLNITRSQTVAVSPNNQKLAFAGSDSGHVLVFNYDSAAGAISNGRQTTAFPTIFEPSVQGASKSYDVVWLNDTTILAVNNAGQIWRVADDGTNLTETQVGTVTNFPALTGGQVISMFYDDLVSPFVYVSYSNFTGANGVPPNTTTNRIIVIDPRSPSFTTVRNEDFSTAANTLRQLTLDGQGNLLFTEFGNAATPPRVHRIANAANPSNIVANTTTIAYTNVFGAGFSGLDVAAGSTAQGGCYPNCDGSTGVPQLTPADFVCFLNRFRAGDSYANCDGSTGTPTLTPADFVCFLNRFRAGC